MTPTGGGGEVRPPLRIAVAGVLLVAALVAAGCDTADRGETTPPPADLPYPVRPSRTPEGQTVKPTASTIPYPVLPSSTLGAPNSLPTGTATSVPPTQTPRPTSTPLPTQPPPRTPIAVIGLLSREEAIARLLAVYPGFGSALTDGQALTLTAALTTKGEMVGPAMTYSPDPSLPVWVLAMQTEYQHLSISGPAPGPHYFDSVGRGWLMDAASGKILYSWLIPGGPD
jgi:hypothetical protein